MSLLYAIRAIDRLAGACNQPRPVVLAEHAFEHTRRWLAGEVSENAAEGLSALATAFELCKQAEDFDLGVPPIAIAQIERLAERLETLGWRRGQLSALAAALRAGERIRFLSFGAVQVAQPTVASGQSTATKCQGD